MPTGFQQYGYTVNPTGTGTYSSGTSNNSGSNQSVWGSLFDNGGEILSGAAQVISVFKNKDGMYVVPNQYTGQYPPASTGSSTWLWVGGAVVLLILLVLFFSMSKKTPAAK